MTLLKITFRLFSFFSLTQLKNRFLGTAVGNLRRYHSVFLFVTIGFLTVGFGAKCDPITVSFDNGFYDSGINNALSYLPPDVFAVAYHKQSNRLFIGGQFSAVTNVTAHNIAYYDLVEEKWYALKNGGLTQNGAFKFGAVRALEISNDGNFLYVGGDFSQTFANSSDTPGLNNIAIYGIENDNWTALTDNGLDSTVFALKEASNGTLYAGGQFSQSYDGMSMNLNNIASYDNKGVWSSLPGNGLNDVVRTLEIIGNSPILYVGGEFTQTADGTTANNLDHIARYNLPDGKGNSSWSTLNGNGLNGTVRALEGGINELYVGGNFTATANNSIANLNRIARYDPVTDAWTVLSGNGLNGEVRALSKQENALFVGGTFTQTANGSVGDLNRVAIYNTAEVGISAWKPLTGNGLSSTVSGLDSEISGGAGKVYVGGNFTETFDQVTATNLNGVASFDFDLDGLAQANNGISTNGWSKLGFNNGKALNEQVTSLAADTNGNVYAGGYFTATADEATTNLNHIARFNPATKTWSALANNGLNGIVTAMAVSGDNLYVGGIFSATADGAVTNLNRIARYNLTTNTWSALGNSGLNNEVYSLVISGGNLYVGGAFTRTFDSAVTNLNRIARYDLTTNIWSPLAFNGLNNTAFALAVSGDDLFVGGFFTGTFSFSGINLNQIARYNTVTNTWSELANSGLTDYVESLAIAGNFLYVNGEFVSTGDTTVLLNGVARYDTQNNVWEMITGNADDRGASRRTRAIVQSGNELYIGGSFHGTGGGVAHFFTRIYLQQWNVPAPTSDWFDNSNWIPGTVPAFNTNAVIPEGAGNINITSADVTLDDLNFNGGTLSIGAGRTLTVNGILGLNGGTIKGDGTLIITNCKPDGIMGGDATAYIQTTLVRCVGENETFNFPVGTVNGYSPVTVKNITGTGNMSIKANQGAYSNPATGLPANRLGRWWQIENPGGGVTNANLHFGYLDSDITGSDSNYRAFRISGGTASYINSSINTFSNIANMENVTGFSDWTLAELAPTAADVSIGGRVRRPNGIGIGRVTITITDQNGATSYATTNNFGYYKFNNITAGATYILSAKNKQHQFANNPQVIFIDDARNDLDIVAIE